jgi:hypothetical protein
LTGGNALNLNVHFHALVLDGVYVPDAFGEPTFFGLPQPTLGEWIALVGKVAARVVELLRKRGIWLDALTEENPMLSHLAWASMRGTDWKRAWDGRNRRSRDHGPDPGHETGRVMVKSAPATQIRAQPLNRLRLLNPLSTYPLMPAVSGADTGMGGTNGRQTMIQIAASRTQAGSGIAVASRAVPRARTVDDSAPAAEAASVTLSPEAQALLDDRKAGAAADRATAGAVTDLRDRLRAQAQRMNPLTPAGRSAAQRIADIQDRLADLLKRMQQALLLGDKRAIAAIAKEAAGLAKELASAVKDAAQQAREAGDGAGTSTDATQGTDAAGAGADASQGADAASAVTDATRGTDATNASTGATQGTNAAGTTTDAAQDTDVADAGIRAAALAAQAGTLDPGLQQQAGRALVTLRALIGAAKAAMHRKDAHGRAGAPGEEAMGKTVAEADKALTEAEADIQQSLGPGPSAPSLGLEALPIL